MSTPQVAHVGGGGGGGDNNVPLLAENDLDSNDCILRQNGWLCGFRVDNTDGPQTLTRQVASYTNGAVPLVEETNNLLTEVITTHNKRESNYVHHGWSAGAVATISPWTSSRIDATNRHNLEGAWITRRTLAQRLRVRVFLEDLAPVPEFEAAIEEALSQPTKFEKFQKVYHTLDRWGDVVPLEIEIGFSLSLTDKEANFSQLEFPAMTSYNSLNQLSTIKTANIARKGAASNAGWGNGTWATIDVSAVEWRPIRIAAVTPTINLLASNLQTQLAELYAERLSYVPPLTIDPIRVFCKIYDDTINASKTIWKVVLRSSDYIDSLSITYLDGTTSRGGGNGGDEHTFALTNGEHIMEILTCSDVEWLRGIQFITNTGRCSAIYGVFEGIPTISRSKGGILAGLSTSTKKSPTGQHWVTGVRGIWRHDLIPKVPKEDDVYSDYFGGQLQHGKGFNDRGLIGNSSSAYISSVEVRAHGDIHSIEITYTDTRDSKTRKFKAPRHGGSHGPHYRFDLERGEHIVSVSGTFNDSFLRQLCFGTNLGRASEVYGHGGGQSFSARAPLGENGKSMRLQYVIGKCNVGLDGLIFVWTSDLS
ncbi:unnamed protein product [Rhizoctonia solani]|uniref:Jacalin-type lectin domain-containing protein n=1 Tax=Rhizoctonia solani TaxID=456999 RepID=A0A8H2WRL3_9AGAM|nr:unnamed protein product [Rhizoctonia solani]